MTQPAQDGIGILKDQTLWQRRPIDQDYRQRQFPRGIKLGARALTARILGDDMADAMVPQQGQIARQIKRAARDDRMCVRQRQRAWRIDKAQQVMMLRPCAKRGQMQLADGQKHTGRGFGQRGKRACDIGHMGPAIGSSGHPGRTLQRGQRDTGFAAGGRGVPAHLGGKGMCRIDDMGDAFAAQKPHQPLNPAKAADACGQRLRDRGLGAPGIGKHCIHPCVRQSAGQTAGLCGAAQKKDARHV